MVIENFALLSQEELNQFAKKLVDKINAEHHITDEVEFTILKGPDAVWAQDTTGDLIINLDDVKVTSAVDATWAASDDDPYEYDDSTVDLEEPTFDDVFKKEFIVDGYKVIVDVDDYDHLETEDVEVYSYKHDDAGIGSYEFWGEVGYDSRPYLDVQGTFTNLYSVALSLVVEPAETNK